MLDRARNLGGSVEQVTDPYEAAKGADALYTDVWTSMGQEGERRALRRCSRATPSTTRCSVPRTRVRASSTACRRIAAKRSPRASSTVPASVVWDQAANRLHAARALLADLFESD